MIPFSCNRIIDTALEEDLGLGDVTSRSMAFSERHCSVVISARESIILCGIEIAAAVFKRIEPELEIKILQKDGYSINPKTELLYIEGSTAPILSGERTALNLLQHLSGIASMTGRYVKLVSDYEVSICDTRKTTPGLRELEKYAVRCGGGTNHRSSLADCILIKDNHISFYGGDIAKATEDARKHAPHVTKIEVEVTSIEQVYEAKLASVDVILLDNMNPDLVKKAVRIIDGEAIVEVSGGVNFENLMQYAEAGPNVISIGAITHSHNWPDIGLDFKNK